MGIELELTGMRFGRLTVIEKTAERKNRKTLWRCRCDCGNECVEIGYLLKNGSVKSCGCLQREARLRQSMRNSVLKEHIYSKTLNSNNRSGIKGVFWNSQKQMWQAKIKYDYKNYHLCFSDDIRICAAARKEAERAVQNGTFLRYYGKGENAS